jgi:hypothetical protein
VNDSFHLDEHNDEDPKNYDLHTAVPTENINSLFTNLHPKLELTGMLE